MNQNKLFDNFIYNLLNLNFKHTAGSSTLTVYAHNLSGFDGYFIIEHLMRFGDVKPIIHNGKLICIKLRVKIEGHKSKTIVFKDSYLILPTSLRDLGSSFKVEVSKSYFPYLLNDINYNGQFPDYSLFTDITLTEYNLVKNQFENKLWNFKKEAIKYCSQDCISLHQVLTKFTKLIFNNYKIDHTRFLTIAGLAMRIWRNHDMPANTVHQINQLVEHNIRKSYTGGAVDVYIPTNANNETLYLYDVNGLYPYVMAQCPMPVGKPFAFIGDITINNPQPFGYFFCKITSPDYLEHPILQRKIKTSEGPRTIAGLGTWTDWIFSEEMYNAMKYGYKFEILHGYEFAKGDIGFNKYMTDKYNLRLQYKKGEAMNTIAKYLSTNLYGKFGMLNETTKVIFLNNNVNNDKILDKFNMDITEIFKLENHTILIVNKKNPIHEDNFSDNTLKYIDSYHGLDVNVAISSAITAYARIHMSYFKNNPDLNLYYSDTDSAVVDKQLPDNMVGTALGQMKLEHVIKKAVFLAPKVYGFIDINDNEIIKAKGLTKNTIKNITVNDLDSLLIKDSIKLYQQDKAFKNLFTSDYEIIKSIYTLKATSNKRELIYVNNKFIKTKPFNYDHFEDKNLK